MPPWNAPPRPGAPRQPPPDEEWAPAPPSHPGRAPGAGYQQRQRQQQRTGENWIPPVPPGPYDPPPGQSTGQYEAVDPTFQEAAAQPPTAWPPAALGPQQPPSLSSARQYDDDKPNDPVAVAAWVLGVLGGIGGIVCGVAALRRIKRSGRPGRWMAVSGIVMGVVWVVGLAVLYTRLGPGDAERDGSGDIVHAGDLSAFSFRLGDCWNDPPLDQSVSDVAAVPCGQAHDAEVYYVFTLDENDGAFPGDEAVAEASQAGCIEQFAEFAGEEYAASDIEVVYLSPTRASWDEEGDRIVVCSASDPAGPTTGSLGNAGQPSYP